MEGDVPLPTVLCPMIWPFCFPPKAIVPPLIKVRSCNIDFSLVICREHPLFSFPYVLFKTLGFGNEASLMSAVITGGVNVVATFVSIFTVDKFGRKILFIEGGAQMFICQISIGGMIVVKFGLSGEGSLTKAEANLLLFFIYGYVAAYAWSWGLLGWLVPSELCSLEARSAVWPLLLFCWLCPYHDYLQALFLPETKNVPIEEMNRVWKSHWFWAKLFSEEGVVGRHEHNTSH
ncbi:sugar transport protein 10-like [Cicer arietinum]|uniref:sugar transport protein 10-like n=1 Tax=Cicer arietinum TaxID=3827 RepID=UPI003CC5044E